LIARMHRGMDAMRIAAEPTVLTLEVEAGKYEYTQILFLLNRNRRRV